MVVEKKITLWSKKSNPNIIYILEKTVWSSIKKLDEKVSKKMCLAQWIKIKNTHTEWNFTWLLRFNEERKYRESDAKIYCIIGRR